MSSELADSYARCRQIARRTGTSFYYSFLLLPRAERRGMCALYAYLRLTDDLGDSDPPVRDRADVELRRAALGRWRASLERALEGQFDHPILPALADTLVRYAIPREYLHAVIDGVTMDLDEPAYETIEDLEVYCHRVAGVVGLACLHIWSFSDTRALDLARKCGLAFQLTNILRDIDEDLSRGRIYLPREDLRRFGYSEDDLRGKVVDARFRQLMHFEISRAEDLYAQAAELANYLQGSGRGMFGAMFETYAALLAEIKRRDGDVFGPRIRLSSWRKMRIAAGWFLATRFHQRPAIGSSDMSRQPDWQAARIAVVGGGLAGLAATVALAQAGVRVELFEARRRLGGRATSYRDPASGELVDHCQHVSMGCCTNLADFCRRVGIEDLFRHDPVLHFFSPAGARYDMQASGWLPAPGHLGPALARLGYLSLAERLQIARAMWRLMREPIADDPAGPTVGAWLQTQGQSARVIEQFWSIVLVSALSETLDRASLFYTRKVFVDGFLNNRHGYVLEVPDAALDVLYGSRLENWLSKHRVALHVATPIDRLSADDQRATLVTKAGAVEEFDYAILALPWHAVAGVCAPPLRARLPELDVLDRFEAVPITGVHLWFDAELTKLPHAVLVGGLSQWLFRRPSAEAAERGEFYYQVVISASRDLAGRGREVIIGEIQAELGRVFPAARTARLLRAKIVTEQSAVFSPRPGIDRWRPQQQTAVPTIALAGDWTATGWPATMEGAVRSGYLAAEAALAHFGARQPLLKAELPPATLSKWLVRSKK